MNGGERSPTRGCEASAQRRSPPEPIGDPGRSEGVQLASHRPHGAPLVGLEQSSILAGQGHVRFHHPAVDGWDRVPSASTLVGTLSARLAAVQTGSAGSAYDGDGVGTPQAGTDWAGIEGGHSDVVHDPCNKVVRSRVPACASAASDVAGLGARAVARDVRAAPDAGRSQTLELPSVVSPRDESRAPSMSTAEPRSTPDLSLDPRTLRVRNRAKTPSAVVGEQRIGQRARPT